MDNKQLVTFFTLDENERRDLFFKISGGIFGSRLIAHGKAHVVIANENGTVTSIGDNSCGQCSTNSWSNIIKVAAGDYHTVGLKIDGTVVAVGDNSCGQCNVSSWNGVGDIFAFEKFTAAADNNGALIFASTKANVFDYRYIKSDDGTITLISYIGDDENVVIPNYIYGMPITKLGDGMFTGELCRSVMKSCVIPDTVTEIGEKAFMGCNQLAEVTIPDSVKKIGSRTFCSCPKLKKIVIPDSVTETGNEMFIGCSSLRIVKCPELIGSKLTIRDFGSKAIVFVNGKRLSPNPPAKSKPANKPAEQVIQTNDNVSNPDIEQSHSINENTVTYYNMTFKLYSDNTAELIKIHNIKSSLIIPEKVRSGTAEYTVTKIGVNAFKYKSLENIQLPESIISIGNSAFEECRSLKAINLPNSIISIGIKAFFNCASLQNITIPEKVTIIRDYTFAGCQELRTVYLPRSIGRVSSTAFKICPKLTEVSVGSPIIDKNNGVIDWLETNQVSLVKVRSDLEEWSGGNVIQDETFIKYNSVQPSYTVPDGITIINTDAFKGNKFIKKVILPQTLKTIRRGAFVGCENLSSISIPEGVTNIEPGAFSINTCVVVFRNSFAHQYALRWLPNFKIINKVAKS